MNVEEKQKELVQLGTSLGGIYPVYRQVPGRPSPWSERGLECGPGWVPLLIEFAESVESCGAKIEIMQVKQKFSALRILFRPLEGAQQTEGMDVKVAELIARSE